MPYVLAFLAVRNIHFCPQWATKLPPQGKHLSFLLKPAIFQRYSEGIHLCSAGTSHLLKPLPVLEVHKDHSSCLSNAIPHDMETINWNELMCHKIYTMWHFTYATCNPNTRTRVILCCFRDQAILCSPHHHLWWHQTRFHVCVKMYNLHSSCPQGISFSWFYNIGVLKDFLLTANHCKAKYRDCDKFDYTNFCLDVTLTYRGNIPESEVISRDVL